MRSIARRRAVLSFIVASALAVGGALAVAAPAEAATPGGGIAGVDVSKTVNWSTAPAGTQFAYIEAAISTTRNGSFYANWSGATRAGIPRGAYAFGEPNKTASNGATQARFFYANGGALSTANPSSLPPVLDIEYDAKGGCWGLSTAQAQNWIASYVSTFKSISGVTPVIYTNMTYWKNCVGKSTMLKNYPLWVVDTSSAKAPTLGQGGWTSWKFRQYKLDQGNFDLDEFHGTLAQLTALGSPRNAGADRFETGVSASLAFASGVKTVYIASGANFPDALSAGAAAGKAAGPVLLVNTSSVPADVAHALQYLNPAKVVITGGTTAISASVATTLKKVVPKATFTRLQGADRFATSAAIATTSFPAGVANAYVAMATDWPDALSGSALAASATGSGPMLLVQGGSVPASITKALATLKPKHITVLGGTAVVQQSVLTTLSRYGSVSRIAGADRFATSALIAAKLRSVAGSSWGGSAYIASGINFPDALVAGPLAALTSSPVLLTQTATVPTQISAELSRLAPSSIALMGGSASINAAVQAKVLSYRK
ncbi:MAG TPA: cell wall-binding repeat-containing protein [Gryllotalpicola sp.]